MMKALTFRARVIEIVKGIPSGRTMSYGEVARLAGNSRAARAVGTIMRRNLDLSVPCHRVIGADGSMGGYNRGGPTAKASLLRRERSENTA